MGWLSTHVLDTARGCPAAAVAVVLFRLHPTSDNESGWTKQEICRTVTNSDGRCDQPILSEADFALGDYELVFDAGGYLAANGLPTDFLSQISIRFTMSKDDHYHVPLLLSPYGYTTYRGS